MFLLVPGRHLGAHLGGHQRLQTNLYNFEENVSPHIFHKKNCCDLNLGEESLHIYLLSIFRF